MTPDEFQKLLQWLSDHPGRSVDLKMKNISANHGLDVDIMVCSATEGICIEWIKPEEIDDIEEIMRQRGIAWLKKNIGEQSKQLANLEAI